MRCICCNKNLSDYESTLRHPTTNDFLDCCKKCLQDIPITPTEGGVSENTQYYDDEDDVLDDYQDYDEGADV
jgi:hypothetical protein